MVRSVNLWVIRNSSSLNNSKRWWKRFKQCWAGLDDWPEIRKFKDEWNWRLFIPSFVVAITNSPWLDENLLFINKYKIDVSKICWIKLTNNKLFKFEFCVSWNISKANLYFILKKALSNLSNSEYTRFQYFSAAFMKK